jgi:NAD(P)-dependent dehydrogenase (short-subunit alcohol dehydrogenase family)
MESILVCIIHAPPLPWPARKTTADGYEEHFQVNYMSHFLLTNLLLPQLKVCQHCRKGSPHS